MTAPKNGSATPFRTSPQTERNPVYTTITVSDNGQGIAPEDLPHIFERFYRGKNAADDSVGIGLALSKTIIEKAGGTIRVDSETGKGSAFTIRFFQSGEIA